MKKKNFEYLTHLRQIMKEQNIDATIITSTDPHQSEIPPSHWKGREWLTGFWSENGTNGTAVILQDQAYCWTDSRFFIQAEMQLDGTGFSMMKEDGPDAIDLVQWICDNLPAGATVGIDGMTFSINLAEKIETSLKAKGINLRTDFFQFDYIYPDRPARPMNKLFIHDEKLVGETVEEKVGKVITEVEKEKADAIIMSALDDIAWVTNLRTANDIMYSPIYVSYIYLEKGRRVIFIDNEKLTAKVSVHLGNYKFEIKPYDAVLDFISSLPKETRLLIDANKTCRGLFDKVNCSIVFGGAQVAKLKSIKNESMLKSIDTAMEKDGVALTRFFMEVEREHPNGKLTELSLGKRLREIRLSDETCVDESFAPIIGWKEHGAIVHYEANEETSSEIIGDGLLLVDSGGQYIYGTTDITRTIALGEPTAEEKHDFTLVMKGHIAVATAIYPEGTTGHQLDAMARQYLWKEGKAYYHGTGHGIGFFINCHEGPQNIRLNINPTPLEIGMATSNEPGVYYEGKYGIRCENIIITIPAMETEFGKFLKFKTVTLFPFDLRLFDTSIMTDEEIEWINSYHTTVRERLLPLLSKEEGEWIISKTQPLTK